LQRSGQRVGDVIGGKGPLQLRAVNSPGGLDLSAESSAQRKRVQPQVGAGLNVQLVAPRIGKQPRPEIKEGTVVKTFAPTQHGDVVQVTVLVAGQHICFKEQGQILTKTGKTGKLCG